MDQLLPALSLSSDGSAEMESSRKDEQPDVSEQAKQEWEKTEFLEVEAVEKVPVEDANSGSARPDLSHEYRVILKEPAGQGSIEANSVSVPNPSRSRADSQLGRVLVANGHGQNADPERLVGDRIECGRTDGQWEVIDPDLDPDDPRFTESRSEGIRQTLGSILTAVYLLFVLILLIVSAISAGYGLYYLVFVSDVPATVVASLAEKSTFGLPYGVWLLIYLACLIVAGKIQEQYH